MTDFQDDPIESSALDEPTVISVEMADETITLIDVDHDQLADVTIERHADDTVEVTVADDQAVTTVEPVTGETPAVDDQITYPEDDEAVIEPAASGSDIIVTLPGDGVGMAPQEINVGPATIDLDDDQRPDMAVVDDGEFRSYVTDGDHDGNADALEVYNTETGELVNALVNDPVDGWVQLDDGDADPESTDSAASDTGTTDTATPDTATPTGEFEVPATFLNPTTYADGNPTMQMLYAHASKELALQAGEMWPAVYPGKPWPLDDAGQPYPPEVLLGIISNDGALGVDTDHADKSNDADVNNDAQVKAAAREILMSYERMTEKIASPGLGAAGEEDPAQAVAIASELADGSIVNLIDTDGDESADVMQLAGTDGSMTTIDDPGPGMHVEVVDEDGNPVASADDADRSGTIEQSEVVAATPATDDDTTDTTTDTTTGTTVDLIDPESVVIDPTADSVVGEPDVAAEYWLFQGQAGTCAPTSVAMVLSEILGVPFQSNQDVVERAIDMNLIEYDPATDQWSGMDDYTMMTLLESYGVDCNSRFGDLDDLMAYLDAGHLVMVGVDADEVKGIMDDENEIGWGEDHALMVTAIDPVNGLVYLNNPNNAQGANVIPLEQFVEAWDDGRNSMIVTDLPAEEAGAAIDAATVAELTDREPGEDVPFSDEDAIEVISNTSDSDVDAGGPVEPSDSPTPADGFQPLPIEDVDTVPNGVRKLLILPFAMVVVAAIRVRRSK